MVETRGPLRSFVSVGLRLCRISSTMIVPPIWVEHSINSFEGSTNTFVKIKGMSAQFFYVHLKLTPKSVSLEAPIGSPHEVVVEVPRGSLNQRVSDLVGQGFTEKAIALDLARDVALKTASPFPAIGERAAGLYDEDPPIWYDYPHRVMNQRPCDHEESGIRAWKIA